MKDNLEMEKAYEAGQVEDTIYAAWEESGYFNPDNLPDLEERTESFSIVLPPPNVTGTLHMGHAVMLAIEDIMTRYARMTKKRALWLPGTDHAAIATQTKVEKLLMQDGLKDPRRELGRETFLQHVEEFAQQSHDTIVNQMKKMGTSVDWSREAFTLDDARNRAVNTVFKKMYEDELIYRGHRVINWCPRCLSTLADDELEYKETTTKLYTFKYGKDLPISIATTRPETKVGDTAIAVHPEDERYKDLVGKEFEVEFAGAPLKLKVVANKAIDKDFGTGALGVTPAHSKIDEEIARENDLAFISVIGEDGRMTDKAGIAVGQHVGEAREAIAQWLRDNDLLESEEEIPQNLSVCYRCDTPVEPLPKTQWFIDVNKSFAFKQSAEHPIAGLKDGQEVTLKQVMQHVVREGEIEIIPERFDKTYFHWIDNLRDWNISRQLWYGHRVPVWYKGDELAVGGQPDGEGWQQDEDTLDTWFSSGLWTFSTLGWPDQTDDLKRFHPTNVLETGYDILFFWVARMILMTTYAIGEVPFKQVYLHGLVRDEKGRKMSKSLGNIIDPLEMIEKYGADATRLSLVIGSTPGNDMKLSEEKISSYRNFTNKLWNIARFVFMNVDEVSSIDSAEAANAADQWILGRFGQVVKKVSGHMDQYEYSLASETLRDFTWNEFADWYVEIAKVQMDENTQKILLYILERLLIMWHPFMPFVTEEVYKRFDRGMLIVADWPTDATEGAQLDAHTFDDMKQLVVALRNIRARYQISPKDSINATVTGGAHVQDLTEVISTLANVDRLVFDDAAEKPAGSASSVVGSMQVYVPLEGVVDLSKEKAKLEKELAKVSGYTASLEKKLANKKFVESAPANVVEAEKERLAQAQERANLLQEEINALS